MMTIKHIGDDGREQTVSVVSVAYDPEQNVLIGMNPPSVEFSTGYAYVMNEHGKTVGTYNLRKQQQP